MPSFVFLLAGNIYGRCGSSSRIHAAIEAENKKLFIAQLLLEPLPMRAAPCQRARRTSPEIVKSFDGSPGLGWDPPT
jgi:hypothetical protein